MDCHSCVCVEQRELLLGGDVANDEGSLAYSPQSFSALEIRELGALRAREAELDRGLRRFADFLLLDDFSRAVSQQAPCQRTRFGAGITNRVKVGKAMHDKQVRDAESARQLPL